MWDCLVCHFQNGPQSSMCEMCSTSKPLFKSVSFDLPSDTTSTPPDHPTAHDEQLAIFSSIFNSSVDVSQCRELLKSFTSSLSIQRSYYDETSGEEGDHAIAYPFSSFRTDAQSITDLLHGSTFDWSAVYSTYQVQHCHHRALFGDMDAVKHFILVWFIRSLEHGLQRIALAPGDGMDKKYRDLVTSIETSIVSLPFCFRCLSFDSLIELIGFVHTITQAALAYESSWVQDIRTKQQQQQQQQQQHNRARQLHYNDANVHPRDEDDDEPQAPLPLTDHAQHSSDHGGGDGLVHHGGTSTTAVLTPLPEAPSSVKHTDAHSSVSHEDPNGGCMCVTFLQLLITHTYSFSHFQHLTLLEDPISSVSPLSASTLPENHNHIPTHTHPEVVASILCQYKICYGLCTPCDAKTAHPPHTSYPLSSHASYPLSSQRNPISVQETIRFIDDVVSTITTIIDSLSFSHQDKEDPMDVGGYMGGDDGGSDQHSLLSEYGSTLGHHTLTESLSSFQHLLEEVYQSVDLDSSIISLIDTMTAAPSPPPPPSIATTTTSSPCPSPLLSILQHFYSSLKQTTSHTLGKSNPALHALLFPSIPPPSSSPSPLPTHPQSSHPPSSPGEFLSIINALTSPPQPQQYLSTVYSLQQHRIHESKSHTLARHHPQRAKLLERLAMCDGYFPLLSLVDVLQQVALASASVCGVDAPPLTTTTTTTTNTATTSPSPSGSPSPTPQPPPTSAMTIFSQLHRLSCTNRTIFAIQHDIQDILFSVAQELNNQLVPSHRSRATRSTHLCHALYSFVLHWVISMHTSGVASLSPPSPGVSSPTPSMPMLPSTLPFHPACSSILLKTRALCLLSGTLITVEMHNQHIQSLLSLDDANLSIRQVIHPIVERMASASAPRTVQSMGKQRRDGGDGDVSPSPHHVHAQTHTQQQHTRIPILVSYILSSANDMASLFYYQLYAYLKHHGLVSDLLHVKHTKPRTASVGGVVVTPKPSPHIGVSSSVSPLTSDAADGGGDSTSHQATDSGGGGNRQHKQGSSSSTDTSRQYLGLLPHPLRGAGTFSKDVDGINNTAISCDGDNINGSVDSNGDGGGSNDNRMGNPDPHSRDIYTNQFIQHLSHIPHSIDAGILDNATSSLSPSFPHGVGGTHHHQASTPSHLGVTNASISTEPIPIPTPPTTPTASVTAVSSTPSRLDAQSALLTPSQLPTTAESLSAAPSASKSSKSSRKSKSSTLSGDKPAASKKKSSGKSSKSSGKTGSSSATKDYQFEQLLKDDIMDELGFGGGGFDSFLQDD